MAQNFRQTEILKLARDQGKVVVDDLATHFAVTLQTIRRDLTELCDVGQLTRVYGGAILSSGVVNIGYEERRAINPDEKERIGRLCAEEIPHEASLFLNIGTTTEAVARALLGHQNLLVVTNNLNVANILAANVSAEVIVGIGKTAFREAALFTHRGLSGPAILQISSYWRHGDSLAVNFTPDQPPGWLLDAKRSRPRAGLRAAIGAHLPDRLAETLAVRLVLPGEIGAHSDKALATAERQLAGWTFTPNGSEGFAKAEVTIGGIDTAGLSSQTMAAKAVPGLYTIGEAVDVTGWLGGYNFQWAWASGWAAGQVV